MCLENLMFFCYFFNGAKIEIKNGKLKAESGKLQKKLHFL